MIRRALSVAILTMAVGLVAYGLYGLSRFAWYTGEYFDYRLFGFDNGVYPFLWGVTFLVLGQLARLRYRRFAIAIAVGTALPFFAWKRVTIPPVVSGKEIFPDAALLNELMMVCAFLLFLALADNRIQRLIATLVRRSVSK